MTDAHQLAHTIAQLATMLPRRIEASRTHLARLTADGWPTGHGGGRGSIGGHGDPVLSAIIARTGIPDPDLPPDHKALPSDVADWQTRTLAAMLTWLNALLDSCDRTVPPPGALPADRCSGHVDATCTELQPARRHPHGVCDRCWISARCPACHERVTVAGRHLRDGRDCCEACYRRELHAERRATVT